MVAFEPDQRLVNSILQNRALNPALASRLSVESVAVSDCSGRVRFAPAGGANSGTGRLSDGDARDTVEVEAVALADYIMATGPEPQVLKIDVEGAEIQVLKGMRQFLPTPRAMLIELHPHAFSGAERRRYRCELVDTLKNIPLEWRFLVGETEWVTTLDPASEWVSRIHAFGSRH